MHRYHLRNLIVWLGVIAVAAAVWLFAVRTSLHFVDPGRFLVLVAVAAGALTVLLWWEKRHPEPDRPDNTSGAG